MKLKEIAAQHGFDKKILELVIKQTSVPHKDGIGGIVVAEEYDISILVANYHQFMAEEATKKAASDKAAADEKAAAEKAEADKKAALASMLITSGFSFDGYTITKYSGYISGDDAVEVDRGGVIFKKNMGQCLTDSLVVIRRNALVELKEAAYALGCNAVVGVDFDYLTLDPQTTAMFDRQTTVYLPYVFCVTANGNAVVIERNQTV